MINPWVMIWLLLGVLEPRLGFLTLAFYVLFSL